MRNLAASSFALLLIACGGGGAGVDTGPMPQGGGFEGVWFSPQYGRMELVEEGANIIGKFEMDERVGHIQGVARGKVLKFQWTEERELISGMVRKATGRGYFVYLIDNDGEHKLQGEWGHDSEETGGGPWNAVKSKTLRPQKSMRPATSPATTSGDESPDGTEAAPPDATQPAPTGTKNPAGSKKAPAKTPTQTPAPGRDYEDVDDLSDL